MTEAGEKWAREKWWVITDEDMKLAYAEFWLRAFCDEVEKRAKSAKAYDSRRDVVARFGWAFDELKRELLGK